MASTFSIFSRVSLSGFVFSASVSQAVGQSFSESDPMRAEELLQRLSVPTAPSRGLQIDADTSVSEPTSVGNVESTGAIPDLRILFEFNSATLTPQARSILDELALAVKLPELSVYEFRVGGHTDASGPNSYNLDLSKCRARSVVEYLTQTHGISPARPRSVGYGERAFYDRINPESSANRRVEVVNLAVG